MTDVWLRPNELLERANAIRESTPGDEFFCRSEFKKVQEALVAATFALWRPWNRDWLVRMLSNEDRFPDFELKSGDDVRLFEIVEADKDGRRRGDEYCKSSGKDNALEEIDPSQESLEALNAVARVIQLKARKFYSPKPNLLVYVNFFGGESSSLFASGLFREFGQEFQSAWLVWFGGRPPVRLWPNPARIRAV